MTWVTMQKPFVTVHHEGSSLSATRMVGKEGGIFVEIDGHTISLPPAQAAALAEGIRWTLLELEREGR